MTEHAFDVVARRAADGVSRRGSLVALSGAALAATFAGASVAQAGKAGKKAKKKCKKQGPPCQEFAQELCSSLLPPGEERDECGRRNCLLPAFGEMQSRGILRLRGGRHSGIHDILTGRCLNANRRQRWRTMAPNANRPDRASKRRANAKLSRGSGPV